jgi:hypothetical protein
VTTPPIAPLPVGLSGDRSREPLCGFAASIAIDDDTHAAISHVRALMALASR